MIERKPSVSIITPWRNSPELIADFEACVKAADQVIIVDNASAPAVGLELESMVTRLKSGVYLRQEENLFVTRANNVGMRSATGEILVFLNNDVRGDTRWIDDVRADVKPGMLCGPSLQRQLVYGAWWPYIDGWCAAGHKSLFQMLGGWDEAYREPYWEDVDLGFRATQAGAVLKPTQWKVEHIGGGTTASGKTKLRILRWAYSFETNRARFAATIRPVVDRLYERQWS